MILRRTAENIIERVQEEPGSFGVCCGCGSIVTARARSCPSCNAHRFDFAVERVIKQARLIASRPQQSVTYKDLMS